jgi:hypothetical protein
VTIPDWFGPITLACGILGLAYIMAMGGGE